MLEIMKQKFSWMVWACLLCLSTLAACSDLELDYDKQQPTDRGIWLSFNIDGLSNGSKQTRSTLQSSEVNYKDVKDVYLYVFNGNTADATCIHAEKLNWKGNITQKHWVSIDLNKGQSYTFMAVGCDRNVDKTPSTYGFPNNIEKDVTKLGNCIAKVQDGKTKDDVAHEQFFVAMQSRQISNQVEEVALTLRRKVAGILVYLRNIPTRVTYKENAWDVKKLQVCLHKAQSSQVALWKADANKDVYGTGDLADSEVLFDVEFSENDFSSTKKEGNDTTQLDYFVKAGNDSVLADSYLAGAYLLPLDSLDGKATLSVNLIGEHHSGEGQVTQEQVLKTYEVYYKNPKTNNRTNDFPIKENTLYAIGKKLSNSTTNGDKPADLSGNLLELEVLPWDTIKLDNVFPVVTGPARIEADYNDEKYVFNAMYDSLIITIKPAIDKDSTIKKPWTLNVAYDLPNEAFPEDVNKDKLTDWIHFETYDAEGKFVGYTNEVKGTGEKEVKVKVVINDYAVQRALPEGNVYTAEYVEKIKKDIRRAKLQLWTEDVPKPYTIQVQQYNTMTIYSRGGKRGEPAYRGIARLDFDCEYDKQTGEIIVGNSAQIGWGYFKTGNEYVSGDNPMDYADGEVTSDHCYNRWKKGAWGSGAYKGSSIQLLTCRFCNLQTVEENGIAKVIDKNSANDDDHTKEKNWYLPAYYEMWGVSQTFGNQYEALGYTYKQTYWTSSGDNGWYKDAYITQIGVDESADNWQRDKNLHHRAMYMVHFE